MMKSLLSSLTAASLLSIATPHLAAEGYPNQAINVIIPLAPGDAADIACRAMADELSSCSKCPLSWSTSREPAERWERTARSRQRKTDTRFFSRTMPP